MCVCLQGPGEWYRLYAVLVHMGYSSNSGHYFCYVKNSNKTWYCMNDTSVTQVCGVSGMGGALSQCVGERRVHKFGTVG